MKVQVPRPRRGLTVAALLGVFAGAVIFALVRRGFRGAVHEAAAHAASGKHEDEA